MVKVHIVFNEIVLKEVINFNPAYREYVIFIDKMLLIKLAMLERKFLQ